MAIFFSHLEGGAQIRDSRRLKTWIKAVVESEKRTLGEVAIASCSDTYITEQNTQFLGHNYPTDIITFGYNEGKIINGDLLISTDTVRSNAQRFGCTYTEELHRVIIHGVLHLLGYDDHTETDIRTMREMEAKCLKMLENL